MGKVKTKTKFKDYLLTQGLKTTQQRELILDEFLRSASHLSTEELFIFVCAG